MSNLQDNQEEPKTPTPTQRVSFEQTLELLSYPQHWRPPSEQLQKEVNLLKRHTKD